MPCSLSALIFEKRKRLQSWKIEWYVGIYVERVT
jgi:hypothetical protein